MGLEDKSVEVYLMPRSPTGDRILAHLVRLQRKTSGRKEAYDPQTGKEVMLPPRLMRRGPHHWYVLERSLGMGSPRRETPAV